MLEQCAIAGRAGQLSLKHNDQATLPVHKILQLLLFLLDSLQLLAVSVLQCYKALLQVAVEEKKRYCLILSCDVMCFYKTYKTIVDTLLKIFIISTMFICTRLKWQSPFILNIKVLIFIFHLVIFTSK